VLRFWYVLNDKRGEFEQVGQTKAMYQTKNGLLVDEDAPKKSVTDALVKCASYLGFAGDIFSGMWDDSKYVEWADVEWDRRQQQASETPEQKADREAMEARGGELDALATYLIECHESGNDLAAIKAWYLPENWSADNPTETEERQYVWGLLKQYSKLRSTIKANKPE